MMDLLKKHKIKLLISLAYIIVALLVYVVWFQILWQLWFVDVLVGLAIVAIGVLICFLWIKAEEKKAIDERKAEEMEKTNIEETKPVENN